MNLKDIAEIADVSIATVSRVLNNKSGVGKAKRKEIETLLIESGFYNKTLKSPEDLKKIAVIVPDLKNPFFAEVVKYISEEMFNKDYQVMIFDTDENFDVEKKAIDAIVRSGISGVILCICGGTKSEENIKTLSKYSIPFVLIDRELDFYHDGVFLDDFKAGFLATEALIKAGHSNIGILSGSLNHKNMKNRFLGYCHALEMYNLDSKKEFLYEGNLDLKSGYEVMKKISDKNSSMTAILSCNNLMTLGILKYQNEVKNSKRISIIGFDNPDYFNILNLNISCVTRSIADMGILSSKLLLKKLTSDIEHTQKIIINPNLILKGSEKYEKSDS